MILPTEASLPVIASKELERQLSSRPGRQLSDPLKGKSASFGASPQAFAQFLTHGGHHQAGICDVFARGRLLTRLDGSAKDGEKGVTLCDQTSNKYFPHL